MPERLHPGVYVEEVSSGVRPIEGVSTSTAAFVGEAARGIPALAQFVTSFAEYERAFGGHRPSEAGHLAAAVDGFFAAGGKRAYVVRVLPSDAVKAQGEALGARGAPVEALKFVARGAGKWADALRINIAESSGFKDEAFRVDVLWTENGASRRVETFDDVRMDPSHEDYVGERLKTSRYLEVSDLFSAAVDVDPTQGLVAAEPPTLVAGNVTASQDALIYEGKVFTVTWWDTTQADTPPQKQSITFNQALLDAHLSPNPPTFTNGSVKLKAAELATLFRNVLTQLDVPTAASSPTIRLKVSHPPEITILPPATTTFDLTGQKLAVAVNGAAPVEVTVAAADASKTTLAEVVTALNTVAGVTASAGASSVTATGSGSVTAVPTLTVSSTPNGAVIATSGTPGAQGTAPAVTIDTIAGTTWDLASLDVDINGAGAANVAVNPAVAGAATASEIATALNGVAGLSAVVSSPTRVTVTGQGSVAAAPTLAITAAPTPANATVTVSTAGVQGTAPTVSVAPVGATTWDLSGQKLSISVNSAAPVEVSVAGSVPTKTTAAEIARAINDADVDVFASTSAAGVVVVKGLTSETAVPTVTVASTPTAARVQTTSVAGTQGLGSEHFGGLRMTISESVSASAPLSLRALGFKGSARGYDVNSSANPAVRPALASGLRLSGGSDGVQALVPNDFEGDARERTGLHALDGVDINLVALPGKNDVAYIAIGIAYCDNRGDCFAVVDGPGGSDRQIEVKPDDAKQFIESLPSRSKNSAMYYPWIKAPDPVGIGRNPTRFVPPSGHVAGIFARTDVTRGVWKAPAGIEATVPEAIGLQYRVIDAEQDLLNPVSLNCLRQFPGVGIVSWGTRTLSSDPEWRYVPVRRMGLFLKESLRRGLQWAVFEPNDEELWGRISINIKAFMMTLFRQGAFQGSTPDEAFAVVCDRTTNPQENVDAGIVTARVAFAP